MAATFVVGRAGAGKTRYCVDSLLERLREDGDSRLILIVPEQASFQMERLLVTRASSHGFCRAEVLSFTRLARRVLAETGAEPDLLDRERRQLALRAVALRDPQLLAPFGRASRTDGFFVNLDRVIESLLRDGLAPEALRAAGERSGDERLAARTNAIAALYAGYLAWLGPERIDPHQRLARLRERLDTAGWLRGANIWVDGFAGFTGEELTTLAALARRCATLYVTLLLDCDPRDLPPTDDDELGLFARVRRTARQLHQLFRSEGVPLTDPVVLAAEPPPRFAARPTLARLERALAAPSPLAGALRDPTDGVDRVRVTAYSTHREEIEHAARWIRRRVMEAQGTLHYRDFALIARDLEPFAETITDVFEQYELPFFIDRRRPMRSHALARVVSAVLDAAHSDLSPDSASRLLRSGLLRARASVCEELDNAVRRSELRGLATWRRAEWSFLPGLRGRTEPPRWRSVRRAIAAAVAPLRDLVRGGAAPASRWAEALYESLRRLGTRGRLERWIGIARREKRWEAAEVHRLAWDRLCTVLDSIHAVLGDEPVDAGAIRSLIDGALREMTLGLAPPTMDQVLVSSIERSRHPDIQFAWLMAFNEGVFPARPSEDALLSADDRDRLRESGLAGLGSARDDVLGERLLAYIALTRASRELVISYARRGMEGEELPPSPLLEDVLASGAAERREAEEDAPPASLANFVRSYRSPRMRDADGRTAARYEALRQRLESNPRCGERVAALLADDAMRPARQPVGNYRETIAAERPGDRVIWRCSAKEINAYLNCPFQHFARWGLALDTDTRPQPLRVELGRQAHAVLAEATRAAVCNVAFPKLSEDAWRGIIRRAIAAHARGVLRQEHPGSRSQRFLLRAAWPMLEEVFLAHAARWQRGEFRPLHCEKPFGSRGPRVRAGAEQPGGPRVVGVDGGSASDAATGVAWPELRIETEGDGIVLVNGFIDRVDLARDFQGHAWLAIYDYKSGGVAPIARKLLVGEPLQVVLYLLAVLRCAADERPPRPGGVLLAPLAPRVAAAALAPADDAVRRMLLFRPRGMIAAEAARLFDRELGETPSPVIAMKRKKNSDEFDQNQSQDVLKAKDLLVSTRLAELTVRDAAAGVAAGDVSVAPLLHGNTLACRRCEFRAVCRFELGVHPVRRAEITLRGPKSPLPGDLPPDAPGTDPASCSVDPPAPRSARRRGGRQ